MADHSPIGARTASVAWPKHGHSASFRRSLAVLGVIGAACVALAMAAPLALGTIAAPAAAGVVTLVCALGIPWAVRACLSRARTRELERSFGGQVVRHAGIEVRIDAAPVLGDFATRAGAVSAALDHGSWAALVYAWDRYWVLTGSRHSEANAPLSFRTRAVADVVPEVRSRAS